MVKFNLRIFNSCQTKHSTTPPEHPSPPRHRHKAITGDSPCTTSPPPSKQPPHRCRHRSNSGHQSTAEHLHPHIAGKPSDVVSPRSKISDNHHHHFRFPIPPFYHNNTHHNRKIKTHSHRFATAYSAVHGGEDEQPPARSFLDVGVRSRLHGGGGGGGGVSPEWGSPARLSVFKKLIACKVEGRVKESFVMVKRSEKPYEDFKKSMMEMIVENEIYEEGDLKQLLQCFLSLNSCYHHGVIVEAFLEIWNTIFLD